MEWKQRVPYYRIIHYQHVQGLLDYIVFYTDRFNLQLWYNKIHFYIINRKNVCVKT